MDQDTNSPDVITLHADKEHSGVQVVVPLIMLAATILFFVIVNPLILAPLLNGTDLEGFRAFFRTVVSVVLGVCVGGIAENILKKRWPSGRMLQINPNGITILEKNIPSECIEWGERINILRWWYVLRGYPRGGRERRVPTGHYLLAVKLLQDECLLNVHSYMKPKQAELVPGYSKFSSIEMNSIYKSGLFTQFSRPLRPTIPTDLLAGPKGKIWAAEKERWVSSFELEPEDFSQLMEKIERYIPKQAKV